MRLVVTGVHGQVVRALVERAPAGVTVVPLGRPDLDLADAPAIAPALAAVGADVVINAAAYTAVDKAETERDAAFAINALAISPFKCALRPPSSSKVSKIPYDPSSSLIAYQVVVPRSFLAISAPCFKNASTSASLPGFGLSSP